MTENIQEKYIATIVLHALGDTIGYKNGEWEFNFGQGLKIELTLEIVYDFIRLGGINQINLKDWKVSDDTILHLMIAESLLKFDTKENIDVLCKIIANKFVKIKKKLVERDIGTTTAKSIDSLEKNEDWSIRKYDMRAGGSGGSMRTSCIGLAYHGKENRNKLIKCAILSSKITHTNSIGYLGGLTSALFTAFAIENININKWPYLLIECLESDNVKKYIDTTPDSNGKSQEYIDYDRFINYWKKYVELKFVNGKPTNNRSDSNLILRVYFHYDNFVKDDSMSKTVGESGYGSVIMAYDSLIDSGDQWEKLVFYSMLHSGDSDTVGAIAASWYGALYGFKHIPENNLKYLEYKEHLYDIGKKIYQKFYLNEDIKLASRIKRLKNDYMLSEINLIKLSTDLS